VFAREVWELVSRWNEGKIRLPTALLRASLGGLQLQLHGRLQAEPSQTGVLPLAPEPEPRETRSLEHFHSDEATKEWLRPASPAYSVLALGWGPPGARQEHDGGRGRRREQP
jgi:hypothetical protein